MSLIGNISMLNAAMRNYQDGLNVTANNIANVLTPGYSRQRLSLSPLAPLTDGYMQYGTGATSTGIERLRDIFLDNQIKLQLSDLGFAEARESSLKDLAAMFPEIANPSATSGIKGALADVDAAWAALAASPSNTVAETTVRDALDVLAQRLNTNARLAYNAQENLDLEVTKTITQINVLLEQIATLNRQVLAATNQGQGNAPGTLLDARETAAQELSRLIDANFRITGDGSMSVTTSGGSLVERDNAYKLKAIPSPTDPGRTAVGYRDNQQNIYIDISDKIHGGKLGGFLQARDIEAEEIRLALDKIAYGMIQRSNEINRTAIAGDMTTNHAIFTGTKASDIALDPLLRTNVSYIGSTRDAAAPGDIATIHASLDRIFMYSSIQSSPLTQVQAGAAFIDPTMSIASQVPNFAVNPSNPPAGSPGRFIIRAGGNSVTVDWLGTDSINDIIRYINTNGGGGIHATFDQTSRKMFVYADAPLEMWDETTAPPSSFLQGMKMSSVVTSSAPINNSPISALNQISGAVGLNVQPNPLNLFTGAFPTPPTNYTVRVNNSNINWLPSDDITTIVGNIQAANTVASGQQVRGNFNVGTQSTLR